MSNQGNGRANVAQLAAEIAARRLAELGGLFPEAFSQGRVDWDKLREIVGEAPREAHTPYGLSWPGKARARQDAKEPVAGRLKLVPSESLHMETTRHAFIEGDNLPVLRLLGESHAGRVKLIYIDPPYNTGRDCVFRDNFHESAARYLRRTGPRGAADNQVVARRSDLTGPEVRGRYHDNWLTMMYARIELAHRLLREDGVMFVSIDDHEVHHLRLLMNEIFGAENFIATLVWQKVHTRKNSARYFSISHEYLLCYARHKNTQPDGPGWRRRLLPRDNVRAYANPDDDPRGPWKLDPVYANKPYASAYRIEKPNGVQLAPPQGQYWRFAESTWLRFVSEGRVCWGEGAAYPTVKRFLRDVQDGLVPISLLDRQFAGDNAQANAELDKLVGVKRAMDYPKPTRLLKRLLQIATSPTEPDLVLDFFAGSGTLGQATWELNRQDGGQRRFILVQSPEPTSSRSSAHKAGYKSIAEIGKTRLRRASEQMQRASDASQSARAEDLGFRVLQFEP